MQRAWLAAVIVAGMAVVGCDRPAKTPAAPPNASTAGTDPDVPAAATQPTSRPTQAYLYIDGKAVKFPPAIIAVVMLEPHLELLLHTDDPPEALSAKYEGNRFYLPIKAGPISFDELTGSEIPIRAASLERQDTPNGIFLDGDRWQLQPYDVRIAFAANGRDSLMISISGQFVQHSTTSMGPPKVVQVEGVMAAELKRKKG